MSFGHKHCPIAPAQEQPEPDAEKLLHAILTLASRLILYIGCQSEPSKAANSSASSGD